MIPLKQISLFLIIILTIQNCQKNNDKIDLTFEKEFADSLEKNNATLFKYNYDGLTPQKSYFVNDKLQFLKIHRGPEYGSIDARIYFDKNDSIQKNVLRIIEVEDWKTENLVDTIFVIYPEKQLIFAYVNNKLVDSSFNKRRYDWNAKFIKKLKFYTEEKYNSR